MASTKTPEDKVRAAWKMIGGKPGEFARVSDLRYALCSQGLTFTQQDEVLAGMYRAQAVNLVPQENQQALTRDQQATALRIGGEDKHLISLR